MAVYGFGVWSLAVQPLAGTTCMIAMLFRESRWRPGWDFSWGSLEGILRFSAGLFGASLLNYFARSGDSFLIGRYLGSEPLGSYSMAYQLMLFPLSQVSSVIGRVTFPMMAQLQNDLDRFRRFYLQACTAIAFITFPMMCGLFVVTDQFVAAVLGPKWLAVAPVLKILCPVGMMQSIGTTVGNIYTSTGNTKIMFLWTLATTPVFLIAFALGLFWGIQGVAACYAVVSTILIFLAIRLATSLVGLTVWSVLRAVWRTFASAVTMAVCVFLIDTAILQQIGSAFLRLSINVAIGAVIYGLLSWTVNRRDCEAILGRIKSVISFPRKQTGGAAP
jgi:O-antigen/teichoic acid export membrane protein